MNASLADAAVPLFLLRDQVCVYLGLRVKAIKPRLALLTSSSHRLFIIRSPQVATECRGLVLTVLMADINRMLQILSVSVCVCVCVSKSVSGSLG
jgi:hypothetical protein